MLHWLRTLFPNSSSILLTPLRMCPPRSSLTTVQTIVLAAICWHHNSDMMWKESRYYVVGWEDCCIHVSGIRRTPHHWTLSPRLYTKRVQMVVYMSKIVFWLFLCYQTHRYSNRHDSFVFRSEIQLSNTTITI